MTQTIDTLMDLLSYPRPSRSAAAKRFGKKFLEPVFGKPDQHGNYLLTVGGDPRTMFTAHYDTVHHETKRLKPFIDGDVIRAQDKSSCLGADCTTGIWLILSMIEAQRPGIYAIFADEEIGMKGSSAFVNDNVIDLDHVISFDRMKFSSIITHQMGNRTCSESFAKALSALLDMGHRPDDSGSYTDSEAFASFVPECTNLSVGYMFQHSSKEQQHIPYLLELRQKLLQLDISLLPTDREPGVDFLEDVIEDDVRGVADFIRQWGLEDDLKAFLKGEFDDFNYRY